MPKIFLLLIILLVPSIIAQEKFQIALNKYSSGEYEDAHFMFREMYSTASGTYRGAALLFRGKTELKLNRTADARKTVVDFLVLFPSSEYRDEGRITLSKIYLEQRDPVSALKEILYLIEESKSKDNIRFAKETGSNIAAAYLAAEQLETMLPTAPGKRSKPFLLLLTGKAYLSIDNKLDADAAFLEILEVFPESEEKDEASTLYRQKLKQQQVSELDSSVPVIAAFLPLTKSGTNEEVTAAKEILEGIKFAVSEYNSSSENKVGLLIRNTENNPAVIEELKKEMDRIQSLKLIIGPIFSDEVRAALRVFRNSNVPIISPTATDDDLTGMNDLFFQANPSFKMRGRGMAQYIFFTAKKRKMGVLNAIEGYSPAIALGFTSEFERLGGEIVVRETYNSGSFEIQDQVRRLAGYTDIDGLFIPLSDKADAPVIINELMMNNIHLPVYGNQDWFFTKVTSNLSGLTSPLTFTSDHFIDYNDPGYEEFSQKFNSITGKEANRNVLYGYDAAKFIFGSVRDWNYSPAEIGRLFNSGKAIPGYHNNICFDGQRVNNYLNIIQFSDGVFQLLDKFKTAVR
jgi:branched-chain amino acid transport system substrate-binding protein